MMNLCFWSLPVVEVEAAKTIQHWININREQWKTTEYTGHTLATNFLACFMWSLDTFWLSFFLSTSIINVHLRHTYHHQISFQLPTIQKINISIFPWEITQRCYRNIVHMMYIIKTYKHVWPEEISLDLTSLSCWPESILLAPWNKVYGKNRTEKKAPYG